MIPLYHKLTKGANIMKHRPLYPMQIIMGKAWHYARTAQTVHGGKVKEWLSVALKRAWAEVKADPVAQTVRKIILESRAKMAAGWKPWQCQASRNSSAGHLGWYGR
jgi:hypothetical protein